MAILLQLDWQTLRLPVQIILLLAVCALVLWCIYDAFDHTDYGVMWLILFLIFPPMIFIYAGFSLYTRNAARRRVALLEREPPAFRFGSEIERAQYIAAAESGSGTLYEPGIPQGASAAGRAAFVDERAEELLVRGDAEAAWEYLIEMYQIAVADRDIDRTATYRHYVSRLEGGPARLLHWDSTGGDPDIAQAPSQRHVPF